MHGGSFDVLLISYALFRGIHEKGLFDSQYYIPEILGVVTL